MSDKNNINNNKDKKNINKIKPSSDYIGRNLMYDNDEFISEEDFEDINDDDDIDYIENDGVTEITGNVDFDLIYRLNTNKHRQEGKHSLQRDTIFKGKIDKKLDDKDSSYMYESDSTYNDGFKLIDVEYDSYTDDYINQNNLTKDVFDVLDKKTNLDFKQNRRKPNKDTFNYYYDLLSNELGFRYTKSELFVELSYYFTDNIFNMFKLLDKNPASIIIKELMQKGHLKNIKGIEFL